MKKVEMIKWRKIYCLWNVCFLMQCTELHNSFQTDTECATLWYQQGTDKLIEFREHCEKCQSLRRTDSGAVAYI